MDTFSFLTITRIVINLNQNKVKSKRKVTVSKMFGANSSSLSRMARITDATGNEDSVDMQL